MAVKIVAVVPAAGQGRRFGSDKAYVELSGIPVLIRTLKCLEEVDSVSEIIPVLRREMLEDAVKLIERYKIKKVKKVAPGGKERFESVFNGLKLIDDENSIVLVHDGVRPLVSKALILRIIDAMRDSDAVVPGLPVKDTVKEVKDGRVLRTLKRQLLFNIQTPQAFRYRLLMSAYVEAMKSRTHFTDDAQVVEAAGAEVTVVEGDYRNIKITTPDDLMMAEMFLSRMKEAG
ncbi:MAG: 2-C-methyl-D-erythritol 4-phosphate cytidylyltransferase [Nitrospirae bacterium]|nr:2-C-methyl-D-erythritol 4-phosphate cytidylyltransferase [Nitrospirota bacterium]